MNLRPRSRQRTSQPQGRRSAIYDLGEIGSESFAAEHEAYVSDFEGRARSRGKRWKLRHPFRTLRARRARERFVPRYARRAHAQPLPWKLRHPRKAASAALRVRRLPPAPEHPPRVTLTEPNHGAFLGDHPRPRFSGTAGEAPGDGKTITVRVHPGPETPGPTIVLWANRAGSSWSVTASAPLSDGAYIARAEQQDASGNVGRSEPTPFRAGPLILIHIHEKAAPPGSQDELRLIHEKTGRRPPPR